VKIKGREYTDENQGRTNWAERENAGGLLPFGSGQRGQDCGE
jgi:hypothetical protein